MNIDLPAELLTRLDTWAGTRHMSRAEEAAAAAARRRPVAPALLDDRRCPYCDSKGMVVAGRPVPHVCADTKRHVSEAEMNPKHHTKYA